MNTKQFSTRSSSADIDPIAEVKAAGLCYVTDQQPGIRREADSDGGFRYFDPKGHLIDDEKTLARIKSLVIPPAYEDVWICSSANGYLQATGRDAKGRRQYRYHPHWRETCDETKYEHMLAFGSALPQIRTKVEADLGRHGIPRERVLATVVKLLETTLIRIGNEQYAKENQHYGLTTLHSEHVDVTGATLRFHFVGKSGKEHTIELKDKKLAEIVSRLHHLPGQEVFQYTDADGVRHSVDSSDVNAYLHEIAGTEFTAKDFRTWAGTVLASLALQEFEAFNTQTQAKKNITDAIKAVSQRLGNTPAVCRKCYVHPAVFESYLEGTMLDALRQHTDQEIADTLHDLRPEEAAVMTLLQRRLTEEATHPEGKPHAR
ncbi:MAG: DNA topoisomerase IB [Janthinobacterium lividum]